MANIITAIQDDLIVASKQGETKFLGSLYGDMLFKVHQLALKNPSSLEASDLEAKFLDHNYKFLELVQELSDLTTKLRNNETEKS